MQYFVDVPEGWSCPESSRSRTTQISSSKTTGELSEANFCFPIEIELETTKLEVTEWPHLLFQINSYDFWDRRITEGYAFMALPHSSGI